MSRVCWAIVVGCLLASAEAPAQVARPQLPEIVDARIGFANHFKLGHWTPIEVTIRGGSVPTLAQLSLLFPDGADLQTRYHSRPQRPLQLVPGQDTKTVLLARIGRELDSLRTELTLVESRQTLDDQLEFDRLPSGTPFALADGQRLYVTLGSPIGIPTSDSDTLPFTVAALNGLGDLPTHPLAFEGVDAVAISTSHAELFQQLTPDDARLVALEQWVESGGHLLLCVGSQARDVIAPNTALARFAPGKLVEVETLTSGEALEEYSTSKQRIAPTGRSETIELRVPKFDRVDGIVELSAAGLPLIIRTPRGFGRITFVACDLDTRPLNGWAGRGVLVKKLLQEFTEAKDPNTAYPANLYGYTDLVSQLNSNIDQFPGVKVIPFWIVALAILGYIGLVGPGDYFFVKYVLRRMELTWFTFPVIVLAVCVAAYLAATWLKGSQLRVNQVDLVDLDAHSGAVRGGSWLRLFSPSTSNYTLTLHPADMPTSNDTPPQLAFSWLGVPGEVWRGMNTPTAGADLFGRKYDQSPNLDQLDGVPIDVWSSRGFTAHWSAERDLQGAGRLRIAAEGSLSGEVKNITGVPLRECFLAHDNWVYKLDTFAAGATIEIKPGRQREGLEMLLKRYEQIQSKRFSSVVNQARPFDIEDERVPPVLRMMMFHRAAGGSDYTRLYHGQTTWTDLSAHLKLGRAVLVGQAPDDHVAAQLLNHGAPLATADTQRWTFYRIVLPVDAGAKRD